MKINQKYRIKYRKDNSSEYNECYFFALEELDHEDISIEFIKEELIKLYGSVNVEIFEEEITEADYQILEERIKEV